MDSNGTNVSESVASSIFNGYYLWKYSFPVIITIILFLLISAKFYTQRIFGSVSTTAIYRPQASFASPNIWPKVHRTFTSSNGILYNSNIRQTVVDARVTTVKCTSSVSPSAQSQNTINGTETDSFWTNVSQGLVTCIIQYQEQFGSGRCGLENLGHSCYINSALQCLCHIRPFIDIIRNLQRQHQQLPPVTSAYAQLLTKMQSIFKGLTSAHELKARISDINRRFAGNEEQDSHEFLIILLEALHDELMDNYQDSSIGDLMHGVIKSTVICLSCGEETSTKDFFLFLPLSIRRSNAILSSSYTIQNIIWKSLSFVVPFFENSVTLYDCLKDFFSIEQLGENGQWFCEKCQNLTNATKIFHLWQLPRVLILQLKRFTCDLTNDKKITTKNNFNLHLDLTEFIDIYSKEQPSLYHLVASVTHSGTLASGHYTTFAKHLGSGLWYHFDDQHVRKVPSTEVLTSDSYILVYERQYSHSSL